MYRLLVNRDGDTRSVAIEFGILELLKSIESRWREGIRRRTRIEYGKLKLREECGRERGHGGKN